ncbi:hypothetical protein [Parapedobacter sp. DT-150]|uniref:hypothetical protein n=1 Tax=Parapedobacter sp. DT-150 TaxID=3396162 RepID=UPI003F1AF19B
MSKPNSIQSTEKQEINPCIDEDFFLNLVAEIIIEIILKEEIHERNRLRQDKQKRSV